MARAALARGWAEGVRAGFAAGLPTGLTDSAIDEAVDSAFSRWNEEQMSSSTRFCRSVSRWSARIAASAERSSPTSSRIPART